MHCGNNERPLRDLNLNILRSRLPMPVPAWLQCGEGPLAARTPPVGEENGSTDRRTYSWREMGFRESFRNFFGTFGVSGSV